ncbi:MAG: LamG-like jellyroll fold domain-containing protein, partial [bacterium]
FRIGINAAGQPYASYDNAEGSPIVASPVAPASAVMLANEWAHLACTYGGHYDSRNNWVGYLKLYKDGELVATKTSSVIPANGWCESYNTPPALASLWFEAPIVVGAADDNPNGWVDGTTILLPPRAGLGHAPPALTNFFKGWLDHIAIWDGARSQEEVQADKLTRLTLGQVAQFATNQSLATILKAYYTFDNRPDPDHSPVSPSGFQVLNQYPATYLNVPWWANAPDKSILYDDYRYVPWIENMVAHIPLAPPRDGIGVSTNSGVVSTNEFGVVVTNGIFRNTANPYGLVYIHNSSGLYESHPQIGDRVASTDITWAMANNPTVSDLLPLRWAVTDEDVPMWDGSGTPAINDAYDTDGDGLPDWWEEKYGFDPLDASGDNGAYGDPDGDGLANIYEYICYTDPMSVDTDGNDISDLDEDFDQDGLSNREELFVYGTHPAFADTDDDGLTDGEEVNLGFAANDSRAPFIQRSLECFGNTNAPIQIHESSLAVKERESFDLSEWTLEAHVNLQSYPTNAAARLIQRVAAIGFSRPVNYELGVTTSGVAYVRYETASGQSIDLVAPSTLRFSTNEWHHIAGRLAGGVLTLFVDGKPSVELYSNLLGARDNSPDLHGTVKMGAGLTGFADELRIWSVARSDAEILASCNQTLLFKADGYGSLSVNGGTDGMVSAGLGTIECLSNQWTISTWFKLGTNSGSGILVARSATQVAGVANNIWNYYLGIDAGGKVVALHTYSYSQLNLEDGFYHNYIANNTLTSLSDVRDGEWHHAAYVWDGSRFYLYVDGLRNAVGSLPALFSSATLWRNFMTSGGSVVVGEGLTATIDETRIYNYGMSAQLLNITRMLPASLIDPGLVSAFNYDFNS